MERERSARLHLNCAVVGMERVDRQIASSTLGDRRLGLCRLERRDTGVLIGQVASVDVGLCGQVLRAVQWCLGRRMQVRARARSIMSESSSAAATSAASAEIGLLKRAYRVIKADFEKSQSQLAAEKAAHALTLARAERGGAEAPRTAAERCRQCAARSRDASCTRRTVRKCAIRVATCRRAIVERRRRQQLR